MAQDQSAMLESGDYDKLDKHEKEAFNALEEEMAALLHKHCNHFKVQFPGLRVDFRFQAEVYKSPLNNPGTVRYSSKRVY